MTSITRSSLLALALTVTAAFGATAHAEQAQPAFVSLTQINVAPGRGLALEDYLRKVVEANDQVGSNRHWTTTQTALGDTTTYRIIRPVSSFAELAPPAQKMHSSVWIDVSNSLFDPVNPALQAFGAAEATKMLENVAPNVTTVSSGVWAHRPDLSRPAAERDTAATLLQMIILTTKPGATREFEEYVTKIV